MGQMGGRPVQEEVQEEEDDHVVSTQIDPREITADPEEFHVGDSVPTSTPETPRRLILCGVM